MSLLRQLTHGLLGLVCRAQKNQDVDEEVQHYFEEATAAWRSRGVSAEDAKQAARLELGNLTVPSRKNRCARMDGRTRSERFSTISTSHHVNCGTIPDSPSSVS